jgi:hypothetical protein
MIALGSKAKDVVSGLEGIVVAEYKFLHGCTRYAIQPPVDSEGKMPDILTFDEPQIKVLRKPTKELLDSIAGKLNDKKPVKKKKLGGPAPCIPTRRTL